MLDHFLSKFNSFSLETRGLTPENLFSRSKENFWHVPDASTLIIGVPSWGQTLTMWRYVKKYADNAKASFLAYEFPRAILSHDHVLTKKAFDRINQKIRDDIEGLKQKYNFKKCVLVGISLGSSYGSMIYKENPSITDVVLVCPGNNLAHNMWESIRTRHFKRAYEKQKIDPEELDKCWYDLSSENNLPASGTNVAILYGLHDKVVKCTETKKLTDTLTKSRANIQIAKYKCGHYLLAIYFLLFPKKILDKYIREEEK
jgi:hypothetical protein